MSPKKVAEVVATLVEALDERKRQKLNKVGSSRPAGGTRLWRMSYRFNLKV
jgi:hypothetical protein